MLTKGSKSLEGFYGNSYLSGFYNRCLHHCFTKNLKILYWQYV